MSCTNNVAINAYVFVNMMLFAKGNIIFRIFYGKINVTAQVSY